MKKDLLHDLVRPTSGVLVAGRYRKASTRLDFEGAASSYSCEGWTTGAPPQCVRPFRPILPPVTVGGTSQASR